MNEFEYQLKTLKEALASTEEVLAVVSDQGNHLELRQRANNIKEDIRKLEEWNNSQQRIRNREADTYRERLPNTDPDEFKEAR